MSLFRFGNLRSPPRRPTIQGSEQSPFRTSPSLLQDITLDTNASAAVPNSGDEWSLGKSSQVRHYTVKEYEDHLHQLRNENFHLKLRIYFLEQGTTQPNAANSKQDPMEKNVDVKAEVELLRKEVSEKQYLLCKAANAMDFVEEEHKKNLKKLTDERNVEKRMMESRIQELETELKEHENKLKEPKFLQLDSTAAINEVFGLNAANTCVDEHAHEEIEKLKHRIQELEAQVEQMEYTLQQETVHSNQLEVDLQEAQEEVECVGVRCQGLELELQQRNSKLEDLLQELEQRGQDLAGCNLRIRTLEEALSAKEPEIQIKVQELCERDRIIEEKQSQIEQQNKVLVEIQITLDEKQRQIDGLRSSLAARDSSIADLEGRLAKARANARNLEAKLDASVHETNRLREEVTTLKAQQKRINSRNREHAQQELDLLSPVRRRSSNLSSTVDDITPTARQVLQSPEDDHIRKQLLELKVKEEKFNNVEESNRELRAELERARQEAKALEEKVKQLECGRQDFEHKLQEAEKKMKNKEDKLKKAVEDNLKACQAIKSFMKRTKDMDREISKVKSELKKRDDRICDLMSELNELKDACNKAKWEAHQLQAQAQVPGGGMPGAFEDVRDMTEEENERLWAEVEDKNKKLAQLTKEKDNLSTEMEKQVKTLLMSRKEDEVLLEEYKKRAATSVRELETRDSRVKELEEDLSRLRKVLETVQVKAHELEENDDKEERSNEIPVVKESKNDQEVGRLDGELQKQNNNLQELVNKELLDKNREIEKLQDRLNSICERKELEIMSLQQQVISRNFQLKMFQDKAAELGIHVNFPTSFMVKEHEQLPVTFNHYVSFQQPSLSGEITVRNEAGDVCREDFGIATATSTGCTPVDEVSSLRDQLQLSVEERKYLSSKVEELRERLRNTPERDSDSRTLRSECAKLREEIEMVNTWRKEAGDASALLTKRLEELAWFLGSLLRHPERLDGLNPSHRLLLKQAVDHSMELSRSLSVSLSVNNPDLTNSCLPPLLDSFSSLLMCTGDVNLNATDLLGDEGRVEGEIRSSYLAQQENLKLCGTSACETTLATSSQCFRKSSSNSEIAEIQLMKDSATSEGKCASRDKTIGEQAQLIAHLRSQVETLTLEIRQRDIEFSRSQKDGLNMSDRTEFGAVLLEQKTGSSTSPIKHSSSSSGPVWKSRTETERLADVEEMKDSLSSMTFYNSQHLSSSIGEQWSDESQTLMPPVGDNSVSPERRALLEAVPSSRQEKHIDVARRSVSSPVKTTNAGGEVDVQSTALVSGRAVLKKQDHSNSTKSSYTVLHSLSVSAVALRQLQSVRRHDFAAGSLSESEAWSEPDRNVSLARIGLNEESTKALLSPGTGVSGCATISSARPRNVRINQEETDTSESSEETAHEISRTQGKRGRNDSGEMRRLQIRLRALEQVNEVLRAELAIMHQMAPPLLSSPAEVNGKTSAHDMSTNTSHHTWEKKLDKSTSIEQVEDKEGSNGPSVTMPLHLLEQIRYQREKLESSLCHNDFIRRQLEGLMSSLSSQGGDNMTSLWQKMKETAEQLEEARHRNQELETQLQEMRAQFEESAEKARLANDVTEKLQVTQLTISILQEQISNLESRLQEKDNEILERKCLMLELENQAKQHSIETERKMQEAVRLKEEAERQMMSAEIMKLEAEHKLQEAEVIITEAEKAKLEYEGQLIETKKEAENVNLQLKDAESKSIALETEKESILREKETIQKDKEITQKEMNIIQEHKETIQREKEIIMEEKKLLQKKKETMQKEMEEHMEKVESLMHDAKKQKEEAEMQTEAAKKKMQEAETQKQDADRKLQSAEELSVLVEKRSRDTLDVRAKETEVRLTQQLHEANKRLQESECVGKAEMEKRLREAERLRREFQTELRTQIEEAQKQEGEIRAETDARIRDIEGRSKEQETESKKHLQELERFSREKERELTRQLDEATIAASQEALERTRLANDKLHLEQELRRHEAREAELVRERKDRENCLLVAREQLDKEMFILQQRNEDLEKCVKELETSNLELNMQLDRLHMKEQPSSPSGGPDSSSSPTHLKAGRTSPGSYSSGFDLLTGEGGSLPNSLWSTTAAVSMEYNGNQIEDKEQNRSRRGSDSGRSEGHTGLSSLVRHALGRQRSELSDYTAEDRGLEEYRAVIAQTCSSSYWVRTTADQHSRSSNSVPADLSLMRNINASPDLGIESDQGRFSSLEAASTGVLTDTRNIVNTVEGHHSDLNPNLTAVVIDSRCDRAVRPYKELEQENMLLKRRLTRTHHALEETLAQLTVANRRKKQVEQAICKQLHKTNHILKRAKINLNAGSVDAVTRSVKKIE